MTVKYTNFGGMVVKENRGGTKRGYVPDPQGNTVALVDSSGAVTDTWEYWPYGEVESHTGSSSTPFTFIGVLGYYKDPGALTYVRARYYNAPNGQWQTMDPRWGANDNPYAYAMNRPTTVIDPTGEDGILDWLWKLLNPPDPIHFDPSPPAPWRVPPTEKIDPSPGFRNLTCLANVSNLNYFTWSWGNCCGLNKKCGPGKSNGSCLDNACEKHDKCVGPDILPGAANWKSCAKAFCLDLKACYAKNNCASQVTKSSECQAIWETGLFFCWQAGLSFP